MRRERGKGRGRPAPHRCSRMRLIVWSSSSTSNKPWRQASSGMFGGLTSAILLDRIVCSRRHNPGRGSP